MEELHIHLDREELLRIERSARRTVAIENGSLGSGFKTGAHPDKKKEKSRNRCRGKRGAHQDGWE